MCKWESTLVEEFENTPENSEMKKEDTRRNISQKNKIYNFF